MGGLLGIFLFGATGAVLLACLGALANVWWRAPGDASHAEASHAEASSTEASSRGPARGRGLLACMLVAAFLTMTGTLLFAASRLTARLDHTSAGGEAS